MNTQRLRIHLTLSADEVLRYYRGEVDSVLARTPDGISVRFPVEALRPHVLRNGVQGWFELEFDGNRKFVALHRISD
ncbi:uncharacterized protein FOKN1_2024 [Thiohalobacter thiocyanaticus]|uniref:DUF2835 family protein n=1 Tax=Thiohalobacter thiocyanaticus TaxID=585455 RepID=A0A1Z4VT78_9GAMM|nr:DUF2835 domain-containing protein [Thiohalobacter thiocyanaticus]BAZ94404.1 uncharacterized protein FOKN1_2024 [Thiohalobacter thiocyanaticus]